jgi:molybdenum cofactor cytidylyltransferase
MKEKDRTAAIILAAGSSSRMGAGRHKLLLPLAGQAVLAHVLEAALASQARPILVVLGHQAETVRSRMGVYMTSQEVTCIVNPDYLQGMSTSLRAALAALLSHDYTRGEAEAGNVDSALVMLGDQPLITAHMIDTLINTRHSTGKRIVAPLFDGKRGNPILFARSLFGELMQVSGDEGGRSVLARHWEEVETVELDGAAASFDVDTWEAYQQVVEAWQAKQRSDR